MSTGYLQSTFLTALLAVANTCRPFGLYGATWKTLVLFSSVFQSWFTSKITQGENINFHIMYMFMCLWHLEINRLNKPLFMESLYLSCPDLCSGAWETTNRSTDVEESTVSSRVVHAPVAVAMLEDLPGSVPDLREEPRCLQLCPVHSTRIDQDPGNTAGQPVYQHTERHTDRTHTQTHTDTPLHPEISLNAFTID